MTENSDFRANEHGINYAFMLALSAHFSKIEAHFLAEPAEPNQTLEETIWAQDMATNFRLVNEYGLQKLADYYFHKDIEENSPQGYYKLTFSYALEAQLIGTQADLSHTLSTEQILAKIEEPAPFTGVLLYTNQLREKLYVILKNAAKVFLQTHNLDESATPSVLTSTLANKFDSLRQQKDICEGIDLLALSLQLDATVDFLRKESTVVCLGEELFPIFKILLLSQLEVGRSLNNQGTTVRDKVLYLRELGNNLMENSSFPQALKVYSEAIHACDYTCSNNIPQLYTNRAIAFIGLNCFAEATSDLNFAVRYDRTFTPAWAQLGYCHLYQGSGFLALKCYYTALRTISGEIYPENFPQNTELKQEYTVSKMRSIMPQFVQRLVQSIILTERRAEQQREPSQAIQEVSTKVRAILARLRSVVEPEDLSYLAYSYENEVENVRATAARSNRARPNILTPDVAQDLMASSNMEASAVTILPAMNLRTRTAGNRDANAESNTPPPNGPRGTTARSLDNLLGFFNNLGEIFNDAVQAQHDAHDTNRREPNLVANSEQNADASTGEGVESNMRADSTSLETNLQNNDIRLDTSSNSTDRILQRNTNQAGVTDSRAPEPEQRTSDSDFRSTIRNFVPGLRGNLGGLLNQALRHHQLARDLNSPDAQRGVSEQRVHRSFSPRIIRIDRSGNSEVISSPTGVRTQVSTRGVRLPEEESNSGRSDSTRSPGLGSEDPNPRPDLDISDATEEH